MCTSLILGRRKVHFTFKDGKELAEEYDVRDGKLLGKWTAKIYHSSGKTCKFPLGKSLSAIPLCAQMAEDICSRMGFKV